MGRAGDEARLAGLSLHIAEDLERRASLPRLRALLVEKERLIKDAELQRSKLVSASGAKNLARLQSLEAAMIVVQAKIRCLEGRVRDFEILADEVESFRTSGSTAALRHMKQSHAVAGLSDDEWNAFALVYAGKVDETIKTKASEVTGWLAAWRRAPQIAPPPGASVLNPGHPPSDHPLSLIEAEVTSVRVLVTADQASAERYKGLTKRLELEVAAKDKLESQQRQAVKAEERLKAMVAEREAV